VVNRVVDDGQLDSEVAAFAQRLADGPPGAYAGTKTMLRKWARDGEKEAIAALYEVSMPLFETEDVQSALRSASDAVNSGKPFPKVTFSGK
jgi:enoyl-CoA hydratase/carnithine racemase